MRRALTAGIVLVVSSQPMLRASDTDVDYLRNVKPIFREHCFKCHGEGKRRGFLQLDTAPLIIEGGESGPAIVPGDADNSLLIKAVTGRGDGWHMPPSKEEGGGERLTEDQIDTLRRWINSGAQAPEEVAPPQPPPHWAFIAPKPVAPPPVGDPQWSGNPIDAFIAAKHHALGLRPNDPADKRTLLRRVYLDLIGLPPTVSDVERFLADDSDLAFEKVVDALLASPRYGERWGRHWMDVWRYSDWYGFQEEVRNSQRHIWRWRDWIVESLNADKGYDQMVREMLAADEIAPLDTDALRATGFLARNWYRHNRNVWLDDTIEHTAKAFLGLTMNCARCHEHKYDPISHRDYYRFRAFFETHEIRILRLPGEADPLRDGLACAFDAEPDAITYRLISGNEEMPDESQPLAPSLPKALSFTALNISHVELPTEAFYPGIRGYVQRETLAAAEAALEGAKGDDLDTDLGKARLASAQAELLSVRARIAADNAVYGRVVSGDVESTRRIAADAHRQAEARSAEYALAEARHELSQAQAKFKEGDAKAKAAVTAAEKKVAGAETAVAAANRKLTDANDQYPPLTEIYPATSSGRRKALAQWITDPLNPLTARVAVNHIWLRHFGRPLVDSVFDFGLNGAEPTHSGLLDHLSVRLVDEGWSMKQLHKLIVTSRTYRMSSDAGRYESSNTAADPDNLYLWRQNVRRAEAEVVRDAILAVADSLDMTMGGPELDESAALTTHRRSLYYRHAPEKQARFFMVFDAPNPTDCYRRSESVVPQQALAMANSTLTLEEARKLAKSINWEVGAAPSLPNDEQFVAAAFERILCRAPSDEERGECAVFLSEQTALLSDPSQLEPFGEKSAARVPPAAEPHLRARENLVQVLLNHNDFVTIR